MDEPYELEVLMEQEFGKAEEEQTSVYFNLPTSTLIRLLKVLATDLNETVACQIDIVDLNDLPRHSAFSYT
jgi:hypothetical protein